MNRCLAAASSSPRIQSHLSHLTLSSPPPRLLPHQRQNPNPHSASPLFPPPIPLEKLLEHRRERSRFAVPNTLDSPARESYICRDSAYDDIVHRYLRLGNHNAGESLQLELIKKGYGGDLFLSNNLINLYAKGGNLECAHQVFARMPERNTVSWTCLITGYAQYGFTNEACRLFKSMISCGYEPTQFTFGSALRACQDSGVGNLGLGSQIHGLIMKSYYAFDTVVCNALISMYGSCCLGSADRAQLVFETMPFKNSITWNSIISVHSKRGDSFTTFELFSEMQRGNLGVVLKPTEYTFGSLITVTYTSSSNSYLLDQVFARVSKSGFLRDLYVSSALVSAFARFGMLEKAKKIFLSMDEKNAVSMNGLMVGLVKQGLGEEAVEVFRKLRELVPVNSDTYVVLLSALAEFSELEEGRRKGREVHGLMLRTCLVDSKIAVSNGLVNMYAKCGAIDVASRVFNLMDVRDQVSWNTMISGLDQNGQLEEALMNYCLMKKNGIRPSNFALISSLSSSAGLGNLLAGTQVHCDTIKLGLDSDLSVSNALIQVYGECGNLSECWQIFNLMSEHDQISWNSMIGALASSQASLAEPVEVLLDMMRSGPSPNRVTFVNLLAALSPLSVVELGKQIHALVVKNGISNDTAVENALITCYAKSGDMDSCEELFVKMSDRRDNVSWNSMVAGYIHNGLLQKAMDFVWFMMNSGQKMDCFTFATVLSACASVAALERGMEIHAFGIKSSLESDVVVDSALVDMYSKCGRIDYASRVFSFMNIRNEFSWNSMISGYARHGLGEKALEIFREMQNSDLKPDHVTFVGVLSACSHAGLVETGLDYFELMKHNKLVPKIEHYSCVVDLLGRAGKLDKMEDFIKRMPIKPNNFIWRTVLVTCRRSKGGMNTKLGKQASDMLLQLEPLNAVNYVLISNLHASTGKWDDVAKARRAMKGAAIRKEAGCSWVTLSDGIHVFVAGDRSHPDTEEIYAKLQFLNQKMRDAGYVPQVEFALYDLEVENKEELLSYHSEKLAVAFVLTRSSSKVPIRIMKNLRVCGDCHMAFRYISDIVGRQIILRDSNRFHHFESGKCSCGDYW
ncbi:putative pentatricopeptide repeat-containing protein At5g09950 [Ananas comosus]|uniref:Pentatricopeptide repeat-containing protein At5g09950 n=2 Tax=Ananas comosus TaxID=4615 RepID=A0A6P5GH72_ANACO|nr:putative pentatricopeptide repeat-containing protein At5g09950 [Ananas comosus]